MDTAGLYFPEPLFPNIVLMQNRIILQSIEFSISLPTHTSVQFSLLIDASTKLPVISQSAKASQHVTWSVGGRGERSEVCRGQVDGGSVAGFIQEKKKKAKTIITKGASFVTNVNRALSSSKKYQ